MLITKEIGGYFGLEQLIAKEFYPDYVAVNNARCAFLYIIKAKQYHKVYLPYFLCDSVRLMLEREHIPFEEYRIDRTFMPLFEKKINPETNEEYEVIVEELAYSAPSPRVALRCFKTPVFSFSNLKNKDVIYSSWFEVGVSYYQEKNDELLDTWSMTLYAGAQKTFVWSSGTKLASTKTVKISDLVDNGEYYLQATCKTVSGLMISTPLVQFSCNYQEPDLFLSFNAENMPDDGVVYLSSNFVSIEG
jgi:hypothetical protein